MKYLIRRHAVIVVLILLAFACGAYSKSKSTRAIAVVNLEYVLSQSPNFIVARKENDAKLNELSQWLSEVQKEINAETDKTKREKLAKQYQALAYEKETLIRQDYHKKLQQIDAEMTVLINKVANKKGCKIVFSKTSVVSGGTDITNAVIKQMNTAK